MISALVLVLNAAPDPTEEFSNKIVLVEPDNYILYWNYTDSDILFEIHVQSTGWISFGLTPNGEMLYSDIIITWINTINGKVNFTDRHVLDQRIIPTIDKTQNWFHLSTKIQDGYIMSKFTRKIKLCDTTGEDLDIEKGTPFVIFAWGDTFNNNDAAYHGASNRGVKTVPLISSLNRISKIKMNEVEMIDFRVNVL